MKLTETEIMRAVAAGFAEAGVDPRAHPGLIAAIVADTLAALGRKAAAAPLDTAA